MTISSLVARNDYVGAGNTDTYDYGFRIVSDEHLLVTVRATDDTETTYVLDTNYTVDGVGDDGGGSITLLAGNLASGYILTIRGVNPLKQLTDIRNEGDFFPEVHEDAFDYLTRIDQQQQDEIDRSAKLPETVDPSTFDASLPADIASNAGSALIVNALGTGFSLGTANSGTDSSRVAKVGDTMTGDLTFNANKGTKFGDADSSNFITVKAPATVPADYSIVYPAAAPVASKFLKYDGTNFAWSVPDGIVTAKSGNYSVLTTDGIEFIPVTTSSSTITITLPASASSTDRVLKFKKVDSGSGKITLDANASETIDGALTKDILLQYESMTIVCDGSNWHVLDRQGVFSNWASYTPTFAGLGTVSGGAAKWRRTGDSIHIISSGITGTCTAALATMTLPNSYTIDSTKLTLSNLSSASGNIIGNTAQQNAAAARHWNVLTATGTSTTLVYFGGLVSANNSLIPQNGNAVWDNTGIFAINFIVPITEFVL